MFYFYNKFINSQIFERLLLIEGTMTWPNGDVYIGNWLNDQLIEGAATYANSVKYKGEFKNNKRSGKGLKDVL